MTNLEHILERQHLLNDKVLSYINDQTTVVDRLVGVNVESGVEGGETVAPNGLIEQLFEAQERTNSLLNIFGDNNRRLIDGVYFKLEA